MIKILLTLDLRSSVLNNNWVQKMKNTVVNETRGPAGFLPCLYIDTVFQTTFFHVHVFTKGLGTDIVHINVKCIKDLTCAQ